MKVFHIESGLGNQMLSYCELLAYQSVCPEEKCYLETIVYDISEASNFINQWNGFELSRIFHIDVSNISSLFSKLEWIKIVNEVAATRFWEKNWNYPVYIVGVLSNHGLKLKNLRGDFGDYGHNILIDKKKTFSYYFRQSSFYSNLRRKVLAFNKNAGVLDDRSNLFTPISEDAFLGQRLSFKYNGNDIEKIEQQIRNTFVFPEIVDNRNRLLKETISQTNSVAIHARRGDMLSVNGVYYKNGYFRRSIKFIKKNVVNPVFIFFCDPDSINWCRCNAKIFGLNFNRDNVMFVDWNKGDESFRDMQLMSLCKHNIITNSSFGWWGAFLNSYKDKITISPEYNINTTHHF